MSSKELFAKVGRALVPFDERGVELLHGLPEGKAVMVTIDKPRNPRQHRLYWALVKILHDNCIEFENSDPDDISRQLKIDCGAVDWFVHKPSGTKFGSPKSLKFESMAQDTFKRFLDRAIYVVCTQYLPGLAIEATRRQIEDMTK